VGRLGRVRSRVVVGGFAIVTSLGVPLLGSSVIVPRTNGAKSVTVVGGPTPPPTVKLVSGGAQPRRPLRLVLLDGEEQNVSSTVDQSVSTGGASTQRNRLKTPLNETSTGHEPSGGVDLFDQYGQVVVSGTNAQQLGTELAGLSNAEGGATVSDRNEISGSFVNPSNADPALSEVADELSSQAGQLSQLLPLEPVGLGARWRVSSVVSMSGINLQVTSTYRLLGRHGNQVRLDVQQREATPRLQAPIPGIPPDATVRIVVNGRGSGSQLWDLGGRFPLSETLKSNAHIVVYVTKSGHRRVLTFNLAQALHETATCCNPVGFDIHPNEIAAFHAARLYQPVRIPQALSLTTAKAVPAVPGNTTCDGIELDYDASTGPLASIQIYEVPASCAPAPPDSTAQQFGSNSGVIGHDPATNLNGARITVGKTALVVYTTLATKDMVKVFSHLEAIDLNHPPANTF
jgi:hypothetical protein